jgi:hypothetical protein
MQTYSPWRFEESTKTIRSIPQNHWIASMDSWDGAENHAANARLIAAAPDLLAALQDLASFDDWSCHENQIGFVMRDIARCALAEMMDEDTQPGATK